MPGCCGKKNLLPIGPDLYAPGSASVPDALSVPSRGGDPGSPRGGDAAAQRGGDPGGPRGADPRGPREAAAGAQLYAGRGVRFRYLGSGALTVTGPRTGQRYRFEVPGDELEAHPLDAPFLSYVPHLRRL